MHFNIVGKRRHAVCHCISMSVSRSEITKRVREMEGFHGRIFEIFSPRSFRV